jgi:hypothetical protein
MKPFTVEEMKDHVREWIKEYKVKENIMKYRKKPVVIEAIQWTGKNNVELMLFVRLITFVKDDVFIPTLEGEMKGSKGDFIIQGVNGEYYPCKPDIFEKTYEKVEI